MNIYNYFRAFLNNTHPTLMAKKEIKPATIEEFQKQLRKHAMKVTPQRIAVHEAMMKLGHASADMVVEEIGREGKGKVTVASVYNILSQLALKGIYRHRLSVNNKMYFDVNTAPHYHIYDTVNNSYRDLEDEELLATIGARLAGKKFRGYHIDGFDLQILCHPTVKKARAK